MQQVRSGSESMWWCDQDDDISEIGKNLDGGGEGDGE